jgi:hypothetical protein
MPEGGVGGAGLPCCDLPSLMVPTPGCCAREDMGAAFAGVFWGVLVGRLLEFGTSMVGVVVVMSKIVWRRGGNDLRGGDGVHLLIADRLRHLGERVMSICEWRVVGKVGGGCG